MDSGDCVYCDPGTFILTVDMADSFGDGWNGAGYGIFGDAGTIYEGSLDSAFIGDGLTSGTDLICLAPGCYSFQTTSGAAAGEISVTLSDEFGTTYGTIGGGETYGVDFTLTGQCDILAARTPLRTTSTHLRASTMVLARFHLRMTTWQTLKRWLVV